MPIEDIVLHNIWGGQGNPIFSWYFFSLHVEFQLPRKLPSAISLVFRADGQAAGGIKTKANKDNHTFHFWELPIEGEILCDMFSLFYNLCYNPDTHIYQIVNYLLSTSSEYSRTGVANWRHIFLCINCRFSKYKRNSVIIHLKCHPFEVIS